jgi:phenylalanyl-tRNA synthetase alpha chain
VSGIDEVRAAWASLVPGLDAADENHLAELRSRFLGKKGEIPGLMRLLGSVPPAEKPAFGAAVQALRLEVESALDAFLESIRSRALLDRLESETLDLSLSGENSEPGTLHPLLALRDEILDLFVGMGFEIADAPEVDDEWFNFSALNVPDDHPARDMQDTFFLEREPGRPAVVLRTHTSNYQIHAMRDRKPPFRLLHCGEVYRCDADATHAPMFCQVEGLVLDKGIAFSHLKATLFTMVRALYGPQAILRFRPSFFPFTEPSAEMDVDCRSVGLDRDGWMEIGGCGMVNPKVLANVGVDSEEFQGFAFGFGLDRMVMLRHGIKDIGLLTAGDMRFLRQFRGLA